MAVDYKLIKDTYIKNRSTTIFLASLLIYLSLNCKNAYAWDDCPNGVSFDPYPGSCGKYVDTNTNGYCDHSEPLAAINTDTESNKTNKPEPEVDYQELITGEEIKTKTVAQVADIYKININTFITQLKNRLNIPTINPNSSFQLLHDNYGVQPSIVKEIAEELAGASVNTNNLPIQNEKDVSQTKFRGSKNYNFAIITIIIITLYLASWILSSKKVFPVFTHRRIWNMILGTHFTITALLGVLLVLRLSYGFAFSVPFNILFWHVEAGIVFFWVALFHIGWHWPYFKILFIKKKTSKQNI